MLWVTLGAAGCVLVLLGVQFWRGTRLGPLETMRLFDGDDPLKRWARVAYSLINPIDVALAPELECRRALRRDWGIMNREDVLDWLYELERHPSDNDAWDEVRRIVMARTAVGARYLSEAESTWVIQTARGALLHHGDWESLFSEYRAGLIAWMGDDPEPLIALDRALSERVRPLASLVPFRVE